MTIRIVAVTALGIFSFAVAMASYAQVELAGAPVSGYGVDEPATVAAVEFFGPD
jgi:hypothetical protein